MEHIQNKSYEVIK